MGRKKAHGHKNNPFSIPSSFYVLQEKSFFIVGTRKMEDFISILVNRKEKYENSNG